MFSNRINCRVAILSLLLSLFFCSCNAQQNTDKMRIDSIFQKHFTVLENVIKGGDDKGLNSIESIMFFEKISGIITEEDDGSYIGKYEFTNQDLDN